MRRGPKPSKAKAKEAKLPVARKPSKKRGAGGRDLKKQLAEALRGKAEAQDQQAATAEILRVISRSPGDIQPVFDAIVQSAVRLCEGLFGTVLRLDGDRLYLAAHHNLSPAGLQAYREHYPVVVRLRETVASGAILDRRVVQVIDSTDPAVAPRSVAMAQATGFRGVVVVPMLRDGEPIGVINVARRERGPFTDRQVALLQTFAEQAVIAIENVRLFKELQEKNGALTQALEQQTATSEILRVISSSPTDVQPVFETIVESAVRLCDGVSGLLYRFDGELIHLIAHHHKVTSEALEAFHRVYPIPPSRTSTVAQAILDRTVIHIRDLENDSGIPSASREMSRAAGYRSWLAVPLLREGAPLGAIFIGRGDLGGVARPFSDREINLIKTFADQAVIAIENVRLFKELEVRNADLTDALARQTATSEILRVISSSPTDVQPVFDTIAVSARHLCDALYSVVFRFEDGMITLVADDGASPEWIAAIRSAYPAPPGRSSVAAQAILERRVIAIADAQADVEYPHVAERAKAIGYRSIISVPMLRGETVFGAINVLRTEVLPFSNTQIALLQTFADQAVIAIENVRLFTELQTSNRELATALDTQTATSDVLRVISRSQTDVQPVFDAIVASAVRLLEADSGLLTRIAGDQIEIAALTSTDPAGDAILRAAYPLSRHSDRVHARVIRDRVPLNVADAQTDPRLPDVQHATARARGYRSHVAVPLLRHDEALGAIAVTRHAPGGFTDDEIALLQTFADQAVIAIENARLLSELQARTQELTRSVGELKALGEVGRAISSTLDLETVLSTIVSRAVELSGLDGGVVFEYDEAAEEFVQRAAAETGGVLTQVRRGVRYRKGEGALGRTAITLEPVQVPDIPVPGAYESRVRENLIESGIRAILAVPMVRDGQLIGCLGVTRNRPGEFPAETIELLRTFATQSALAIQNARLFRELADKSRQLEVASQHKSEFLANMSHELRTPLNAIIGFSEVLTERMFGELNEKQEEYLKDIYASGQHLLSLINDILDLSKIEAGRMELDPTDFDLPTALDSALTLVRERAGRRGIALHMNVDGRLGQIQADERKVRQVVLNLLSNAIKFTPEGGRIEVVAVPRDGLVEVSVSDTGVGIAPEDQEAIFEEFRQVGTADKKVEGTGLGLALSRKFVELHGGKIWVTSQVGEGSTFTFTIPVRHGE
jgi:GAF domain-containing protein